MRTIITEKYHRDYTIDRGQGFETVRWSAWYKNRPGAKGYAMTEAEAIEDLKHPQ